MPYDRSLKYLLIIVSTNIAYQKYVSSTPCVNYNFYVFLGNTVSYEPPPALQKEVSVDYFSKNISCPFKVRFGRKNAKDGLHENKRLITRQIKGQESWVRVSGLLTKTLVSFITKTAEKP